MDFRRLAPYLKIALFCAQMYLLYSSFRLLFNLPENTYLVFHGSIKGGTDFRGCLFGEQKDCPPGAYDTDIINKILLHLKQKSADNTGEVKKNEQSKQKGAPDTGDESKHRDGHKERVKEERHGDGRTKDGAKKEIPIHFLKQSMGIITDIMNELVRIDPNPDRSLRARQGVMVAVSCYEKLLAQGRMKDQGAYSLLTKKKARVRQDGE